MVLNEPQPLRLLLGEMHRTGVAAEDPCLIIGVHRLGKGNQLVPMLHLKADHGDQVSQLADILPDAAATYDEQGFYTSATEKALLAKFEK